MNVLRLLPSQARFFATDDAPRLIRKAVFGFFTGVFLIECCASAPAEEPVDLFLERLRSVQLFDLAKSYLDLTESEGLMPTDLQKDAGLEKTYLLQESLVNVRSSEEEKEIADQVESELNAFIDQNPQHPRLSEARLKLADFYFSRGKIALDALEEDPTAETQRQLARKSFQDARSLFERTLASLREILEGMRGAKISNDDLEGLARRDELQNNYRQAEILKGLMARFIAETYDEADANYKTWLNKAEQELTEVVNKTTSSREAGRHMLSLLYRGQIQSLLGKTDEAYDSFVRVADTQAGGDVFRKWRAAALAGIVKLYANPEEKKYQAILPKADEALKQMDSKEQMDSDWLELQFATFEGKIAWATDLEAANQSAQARNLKSSIRKDLQNLARRRGPQQERAKEILARLGVAPADSVAPESIPDFKSLTEAIGLSRERLESAESMRMQAELLEENVATANAQDKENLLGDLEASRQSSNATLDAAITILRNGLLLANEEDDRETIDNARYFLAFAHFRRENFWEAASIGDFITRTSLGADSGLRSGGIALAAYGKAIESLSGEQQLNVNLAQEDLAKQMLDAWPTAPQRKDWISALLATALKNSAWDKAEEYLNLMSSDPAETGRYRREIGFILWAEFLRSLQNAKAEKRDLTEQEVSKRDRAVQLMQQGWDSLASSEIDLRAIQVGSALADHQLRFGSPVTAMEMLVKESVGPLTLLRNSPASVSDPNTALEILRNYLQAMVLVSSEKGQPLEVPEIEKTIAELQALGNQIPNGKPKVAASLVLLGSDLLDKVRASKVPAKTKNLASALGVLLQNVSTVTKDLGILNWTAAAALETASQLKDDDSLQDAASQLYASATESLTSLTTIAQQDPAAAEAAGVSLSSIRLKNAIALSGQGKFPEAIEIFDTQLAANPLDVLAQMEAARALQDYGTSQNNADHLTKALFGNDRGIWGWGKLAQKTARQMGKDPNFKTYFALARFGVAECRFELGQVETDPTKKTALLEQAGKDIKTTLLNLPDLGGQEIRNQFDQLARKIQKTAGKTENGLAEFQ